jgi:hypothetical protein
MESCEKAPVKSHGGGGDSYWRDGDRLSIHFWMQSGFTDNFVSSFLSVCLESHGSMRWAWWTRLLIIITTFSTFVCSANTPGLAA